MHTPVHISFVCTGGSAHSRMAENIEDPDELITGIDMLSPDEVMQDRVTLRHTVFMN